ncbi:MAG: protein O-mannosyl-transferase [Thermoanaerobaculia bacterium]|jgi:tetratricopeptide (TPR) repeat protein|nr:protein O-mannosyl-transferase [Thermoanaerobaculia bacterium]
MGKKARKKREVVPGEMQAEATRQSIGIESANRRVILGIVAGITLAVFSIFFQLRSHQFINFDDPIYVTENAHVRAGLTADGLRWAMTSLDFNWHPLTWFTHMLDVQLFGVNPGAHLLVNGALHLANSLLVFAFLLIATGRVWRSGIVAGLFAVHPLHVESVAWISERKDVLCAFFFLLGILLHCRFVQTRSKALYAGVIAAFVLGLMSKGMIITLPFVLLVVDYWPLQRWSYRDLGKLKPLIIEKIPLFLLVIPAALVTLKAQEHVKAVVANIGLIPRLANAAIAYVFYLVKTVWPSGLAVFYPYRTVIAPSLAIMATLFLIGVTVLVLRQAAVRPYLAAGWFWYLGVLVPVIGLVQIGIQSMADRYTYLPLIGIFAAITWLAAEMIHSRAVLTSVASIVIIVLAIAAHQQAGYWQDSLSLFSHAVEVTTTNATAEGNLGEALIGKQNYEAAAQHYRAALAADAGNGPAHNGLGLALIALGDSDGAAKEWRAALATDPTLAEPYRNLGWFEMTAGRKKEAAELFEKSIRLKPEARTYAELASANGNLNEAIRRYQEAVAANPESADVHNDFAATLALAGRDQQALEQYQAALRLAPGHYDAEMNVGALLSRMGQNAAAIDHFRLAGLARPRSFEPHIYLALVAGQIGRQAEAIAEMQKALAIDPVHANAQVLQATGGQFDGRAYIAGLQAQHSP